MAGTALFDLDKTITRHGTWSRFVRYATGGGLDFWGKLPLAGLQAVKYKAGLANRASVKVRSIELYLEGRTRTELDALARRFVEQDIAQGLRKQARTVIEAHRAAGDQLIIASAAVDLIVAPMAEALGFDGYICTNLQWDANDRLLAPLDGENCYGEEKLRRVEAYFDGERPTGPISFYSDHVTDLPCLVWADKGVAVNPNPPLRRQAPANEVEIVDWDA